MSKSMGVGTVLARQRAPAVFEHVAGVYVLAARYVKAASHLLDGRAFGYQIPPEQAFDIDSELDFTIFGDGSGFDIEICYLREKEKLGTAGALSLLPEMPQQPIIVMNGDILTNSDFASLHAFHVSHGAYITLAAVDYRVSIPYGVIHAEGPFVRQLEEKPSQRFFCNAGIYAVSPQALGLLQETRHCNMTDLIENCLARSLPVAVFPVHEYWSDIGTPDDLEKARALKQSCRKGFANC